MARSPGQKSLGVLRPHPSPIQSLSPMVWVCKGSSLIPSVADGCSLPPGAETATEQFFTYMLFLSTGVCLKPALPSGAASWISQPWSLQTHFPWIPVAHPRPLPKPSPSLSLDSHLNHEQPEEGLLGQQGSVAHGRKDPRAAPLFFFPLPSCCLLSTFPGCL